MSPTGADDPGTVASWTGRRERRAASRYLLAWDLLERVPEPAAWILGKLGGRLYYRLDERARDGLRANLRHVLGTALPPKALDRVGRQGIGMYARYWVEAFQLERLTRTELISRMSVDGMEHIDRAVAAGRGAILAVPHLGNWDAGGAWLAATGCPVSVVVERLRPAELFDRFLAYREALGMQVEPLDEGAGAMRAMLRALGEGRVVCLVCDRALRRDGVPVRMFGAPTVLPGGPAALALRSGAALLPAAVYQSRPAGRWLGVCRPPLVPERTGDHRDEVSKLTVRLAAELERLVARSPAQWHVLERFWPEPAQPGAGR